MEEEVAVSNSNESEVDISSLDYARILGFLPLLLAS